jgi:hypothetical protein
MMVEVDSLLVDVILEVVAVVEQQLLELMQHLVVVVMEVMDLQVILQVVV